ncbi:PleD family two-component system response regulator [Crenobacter sp. SG2303]|uniref:diguanylate cyclase n=1 Tax=Crenobacter oryzisoli TaxID=3056844 RepID=A0ABT7XT69_9NEIS|nr:PleD family two-component system response regulator [Crenobacter sp. SG2303]MDN0076991.1 PleD family two-component system response regulator [Crenobacter sp. SG2303]
MEELNYSHPASPASAGFHNPSTEPVMVLLVDDQVMVGEAVRRMLANEPGIDYHFCANPDDALRVARCTRPTVILQDLVMPGIDGLALVAQYRADPATRDTPVIVLSTKEEPAIKSAAFAQGANDYLVKLPDSIELVARIRYHSRSYLNQLQRDEAYRALRESQQKLLAANLELQRLTNSDGLTGLANRRYFDEYLNAEWRRARRQQMPFSVLMIDVDNFKLYNDSYGHIAGDIVLKKVADALLNAIGRSTDLVARFGGEEFAILLPNTPSDGAELLAEKARHAVETLAISCVPSDSGQVVTISVGGATLIPDHDDAALNLIEAADLALYEAKRLGKNRVVVNG